MKILTKYVLREHLGPFAFALTALTSLMLLNFISRQFGELVGKGLPWSVIGEFFLLSIPFTIALTLPMSVLVAVLYAFSRLAAENEVTALNASGVSPWRLVSPAIVGGVVMSIVLLAFNDQVLPRANHRLKTLQDDISQAKPTFLLKEQVINPIAEGKFYLKAGKIDRASARMKEVVIYDMSDPSRRRTIYADSGSIEIARTDLNLHLYHGQMQEIGNDKPSQLNRLFYDQDRVRIANVTRDFKQSETETTSKGDREMGVCEMQRRLWQAESGYQQAKREYDATVKAPRRSYPDTATAAPPLPPRTPEPRGIGWVYCKLVNDVLTVPKAKAQTVRPYGGSTVGRQPPSQSAVPRPARRLTAIPPNGQTAAAAATIRAIEPDPPAVIQARTSEAKLRLDMAQRSRNRYEIEIHKKFSLAAACLIFVLLGAPIAVRFPRGGVGLVIGVSLIVFALYYVGLIGGESLANEGYVPPFWAMWGTNVILTLVGIVLLFRMGKDSNSGRGGDWGDRIDAIRARFGRGPHARRRTAA